MERDRQREGETESQKETRQSQYKVLDLIMQASK